MSNDTKSAASAARPNIARLANPAGPTGSGKPAATADSQRGRPGVPPDASPAPAAVRSAERAAEREKAAQAAEERAQRECVHPQDLAQYQAAVVNAELAKRLAETASARASAAAQASNAARLGIFVKYGLKPTDAFDAKTGVILRGASAAATPDAPEAEKHG